MFICIYMYDVYMMLFCFYLLLLLFEIFFFKNLSSGNSHVTKNSYPLNFKMFRFYDNAVTEVWH